MTFDRLIYVDRLTQAGMAEPLARAHAEALREALVGTVATAADIVSLEARFDLRMTQIEHKIELTARDLTIKGAGGLIVLASLMVGLKLFG